MENMHPEWCSSKKGVLQSWWMEHVGHSAQFYVRVGLFICTNQRDVFLYHSGTKVQYIFMSLVTWENNIIL